MIEMWVRTVDHDPRTGQPVAVLLLRIPGACPPVALPVSPADACTLSHELQGMTTLRTCAFMLLDEALASVEGYATDIWLASLEDGTVTLRVGYWHRQGRLETDVDVSLALGLAAHLGFMVLVPESLLAGSVIAPRLDQPMPVTETPAVFRLAFED